MPSLVILGAGHLGGALARQLATANAARRIVLVDEAGDVAAGKALDIRQATPVDPSSADITGTSDIAAVVGASFILIADRHDPASDARRGDVELALLRQVIELNQTALLLCAGAHHMALVEQGVTELQVPRRRLFGSAAEALRGAIIGLTALEAECAPRDVSLMVLGRPPDQTIVPWDDASIAGRSAPAVLTPPALTRLDARLGRLWPPGPLTLAAAATRVVCAARSRSPQIFAGLVALTREEGRAGYAAAWPITVNPGGIARIVRPSLSARNRVRLDVALGA